MSGEVLVIKDRSYRRIHLILIKGAVIPTHLPQSHQRPPLTRLSHMFLLARTCRLADKT